MGVFICVRLTIFPVCINILIFASLLALRICLSLQFGEVMSDDSGSAEPASPISPLSSAQILANNISRFSNNFKVVHINAQSLRCHIDEVRELFLSCNVDAIGVSESWLKPDISNLEIQLPGYNIIRNDRIGKAGGGVAIYLRSHIPYKVLFHSPSHYCSKPEYLFIEVIINNSKCLLSVCYRPPKIGFLSEFENALLNYMPSHNNILVMGDFNTDLLSPGTFDYRQLTSIFYSCNLTFLPLHATHHTANSHTLLDLIAVSDPSQILHHGQISVTGISSHDLVFCVYSFSYHRPKTNFIQYRDHSKINIPLFVSDAFSLPWDSIYSMDNVDDMVYTFNNLLLSLYDKHAPKITRKVRRRPSPWITAEIRNLMAQRDHAYRKSRRTRNPDDLALYKQFRNRVKQELRNARIRFTYRSLAANESTLHKWRTVKKLGIGKRKDHEPLAVNINELNDFFVSPPGNSSAASSLSSALDSMSSPNSVLNNQFRFTPIDSIDVLKAISRISSNASGADSISIRLIKDSLFATLDIITFIFNKSLSTSIFPSSWKSSIIIPLKKVQNPSNVSDYRPISLLPVLSKCLEKIVLQQINIYLNRINILNIFQSGFRKHHSTTTALIEVTDSIRSAMDNRMSTILILFDLSKAFDCVHHPLLLKKMEHMGFSVEALLWFRSYLSPRRQCIKTNTNTSIWKSIERGVPQGSILGPLLFSLYINDINKVFNHCNFHLFADDLQVYLHFPPNRISYAVDNINRDINVLTNYITDHALSLNIPKTKTILICYTRLLHQFADVQLPCPSIGQHVLHYNESVRSLGVILNKTLNWGEHVNFICNKVFAGVHSLKRVRECLPLNMRLMLVKTLIFPYFSYGDVVYNDLTVELAEKLQRAQNYCLRFIFNLRRDEHISSYYQQTSILRLENSRKLHMLRLLFKTLKNKAPAYIFRKFTFSSQISSRNTRNSNSMLIIPLHRTVMYNKSFAVTAARLWNSLPDEFKTMESSARFDEAVRGWLLRGASLGAG
jgi:hypothetical protein